MLEWDIPALGARGRQQPLTAGPSLSAVGWFVPVKRPSTSQGAAHWNCQNPSGNRVYFKHRNLVELLHINAKNRLGWGSEFAAENPTAGCDALDN